MTVYIVLFAIVIPALIFFVWSNYSHLSKLRKLNTMLSDSKILLEDSRLLLSQANYQLSLERTVEIELENKLLMRHLTVEKTNQENLLAAFKGLSRPANKDLEKQDALAIKYEIFEFPILTPERHGPDLTRN